MIDHKLPKNWRDLQKKVGRIFREIGYETYVDKEIELARGKVKIDVFAKDRSQLPNIIYLCECKNWNRRVPKTIIHSFRTVVLDFGANYGIIISKKGFQKGAIEASEKTNIKLVDWFGFQEMFEEKWLPAISYKLYDKFEALIDYTEPLPGAALDRKLDRLSEDKLQEFRKLHWAYMEVGMRIVNLRFGDILTKEGYKKEIKFPFKIKIPKKNEEITISSLREYINFLSYYGKKALKEFNNLLN